ncbi:MAG TPA: hydroxyacid dehydrogenase [Casimicrobiaceae bacterium]|nr:hydroxyacid dehydrogenase [Casimicrobiaceae bacterium]
MNVVISEFMDEPAVAWLAAKFEVRYDAALVDRHAELTEALAGADALIVRNRTQVDRTLLAAGSRLKVVGRLGVGLDNVDVAACEERGIRVIPATGANALAVAEYVIATAMLLLRGVYGSTAEVGRGEWPRAALSGGREIDGKILGIVGFGGIGRLTAGRARSLGMRVIAFDPQIPSGAAVWTEEQVELEALDDVLRKSDVVTLHVPLTPATRGLIDGSKLALMKADAVLINTARGGIVDEAALAAAIRAGKLGGAALDVFASEPLPRASPLADCPRLILTPHVAGVTRESNTRVSTMIAAEVAAELERPRRGA